MENLDTVCKPKTKWLTKDRFWNFVFWFGMSGGFLLTPKIPSFTFWVTIIGIPLLVRYFSKTTFVKETIFKNSEGMEFDAAKRFPNMLFLVLSTVGLTALTGLFLDAHKEIPDVLSNIILFIVMFGVPSLFFIFKDCPISILLNRKTWQFESYTGSTSRRFTEDSMATKINSIKYSYLTINRHHRH